MDLTQGTDEEKLARAKRMMLWFGIISLGMSFAGLTSAFIVSRSREDWLQNFELPQAFTISTIIIIVSSITMYLATKSLKAGRDSNTRLFLIATFILGVGFVYSQFEGFAQIIEQGYYFTGASSNVTMSFIYVIAGLHIAHVVAGLIALLVVIYNHYKQRYINGKTLGFELAATFWHFIDILWLALFLFLYFYR